VIFADQVSADAVYRDDGEVRTYNFVAQAAFYEVLHSLESGTRGEKHKERLRILEVY
jgi:hypothetical protein